MHARILVLSQGLTAQVDDVDFEWLNQWKWSAAKRKRTWYAVRNCGGKLIYLHKILAARLGIEKPDHKDRNGLNNRRENLREASARQNAQNTTKRLGCRSEFKGVTWCNATKKWRAKIRIDGLTKHLGRFSEEREAAAAYDKAATAAFGAFACVNFS